MAKRRKKKIGRKGNSKTPSPRTGHGNDVQDSSDVLEMSSPSKSIPTTRQPKPPSQPSDSSVSQLRPIEWIGLVGLFLSLAVGFVFAALAAAGTIDLSVAKAMLVAALIVMVVGAVVVEWLSKRPFKRVVLSTAITGVVTSLVLFYVIRPWMVQKRNEQDTQSKATTIEKGASASEGPEDLRSELRADGHRAIRTLTMHVRLKRKYSIDEIGHFRIMYEVARITNQITPDFYLACQDYYGKNEVNPSVDPNVNQFGYRTTIRYRDQDNTYRPTPSYDVSAKKYGSAIEATREVDDFEITWDLYDQIPSYKILDDLNGKSLYIFVTASLADKVSEVAFRVNNWELFAIKSDNLIFPDDVPIAPWFIALSKEEKAVSWKGVYVRNDLPMPSDVTSRFKGNPGWTWSLDFGLLHPRKIPEPTLQVDPFKPTN
jgi:hypothetical protein